MNPDERHSSSWYTKSRRRHNSHSFFGKSNPVEDIIVIPFLVNPIQKIQKKVYRYRTVVTHLLIRVKQIHPEESVVTTASVETNPEGTVQIHPEESVVTTASVESNPEESVVNTARTTLGKTEGTVQIHPEESVVTTASVETTPEPSLTTDASGTTTPEPSSVIQQIQS